MHHALKIQEILHYIFTYCAPPILRDIGYHPLHRTHANADLAALARTCRAFKEPALDILWKVLRDLSPLARCLPEASHRLSPENVVSVLYVLLGILYNPSAIPPQYSFTRQLTQREWDILRSYTRRIRHIQNFNFGLNWQSVATFFNPAITTSPLFPNLHHLSCQYTKQTMALLDLPLPSLTSLDVAFTGSDLFHDPLKMFPNFSPKIQKLIIHVYHLEDTFTPIPPNYICRWKNLSFVLSNQVAFDGEALVHLSCMPALTRLSCALCATLPAFDSPPSFSHLHELDLTSESLESISRLLSQIRLPAITHFNVEILSGPSRQQLSSLFAGLLTSNVGCTIEELCLNEYSSDDDESSDIVPSEELLLGLEDLRPCMAFSNLLFLQLNLKCDVGLGDNDLLTLASAWPKLEQLSINDENGWHSQDGGITPGGLLRLLQMCRSLLYVVLRLDTRGYTEVPPSQAPPNLGLTLTELSLYVVDAVLEAESVPAVATFLFGIATCCKYELQLSTVESQPDWMMDFPNLEENEARWKDVRRRVKDDLARWHTKSSSSVSPSGGSSIEWVGGQALGLD